MTALNIIRSSKSIWKEWHDDRTGRQPQGRRPHRLSRTRERPPRPQLAIATQPGRACAKVAKRTGYIVRLERCHFDRPLRSDALRSEERREGKRGSVRVDHGGRRSIKK